MAELNEEAARAKERGGAGGARDRELDLLRGEARAREGEGGGCARQGRGVTVKRARNLSDLDRDEWDGGMESRGVAGTRHSSSEKVRRTPKLYMELIFYDGIVDCVLFHRSNGSGRSCWRTRRQPNKPVWIWTC